MLVVFTFSHAGFSIFKQLKSLAQFSVLVIVSFNGFQEWLVVPIMGKFLVLAVTSFMALTLIHAEPSTHELAVRNHVESNPRRHGVTLSDVLYARLTNILPSKAPNITHVFMKQAWAGISISGPGGGNLNAVVRGDNEVVSVRNSFTRNILSCVNTRHPTISAEKALHAVASYLSFPLLSTPTVLSSDNDPEKKTVFAGRNELSMDKTIPAQLILYKEDDSCNLRLSWELVVHPNDAEWLEVIVDAMTGQILHHVNYVSPAHESFSAISLPQEAPCKNCTHYYYFGQSFDVYNELSLQLLQNQYNAIASREGWVTIRNQVHNETIGNNVIARADIYGTNRGNTAPATSNSNETVIFDYTSSNLLSTDYADYTNASIVSLFYWNNVMHDILYQYGFDEASGNFQKHNYMKGGKGNDYINADAQVRLVRFMCPFDDKYELFTLG